MSKSPVLADHLPGRRWSAGLGRGFYVKLVLMCLVDALGLYGLFALYTYQGWAAFWIMLAGLLVVNVIYFVPRFTAAKYLTPGLIFLLVYQVYVVLYTGYAAFTNYGDGHNSTQADATAAILARTEDRVPDSLQYPVTLLVDGNRIALAVVNPTTGKAQLGTAEQPLTDEPTAVIADGRVSSVPGWQIPGSRFSLPADVRERFSALRVPISTDPAAGSLRTKDFGSAYVYRSTMHYDPAAQTLTDTTNGTTYAPDSHGNYVAPDGTKLTPGWKVNVGFENFTRVLTDGSLRGPFLSVFVWTFIFAALTVAGSFIIGLLLALALNDARMRGRKIYRSLLILPYAFPALLSALVWRGLLNRDFGWINQVLLGGASVDWLNDPLMARISVLGVNWWLAFPYMFLVATGALQAIPAEMTEAASMDGATARQAFFRIKFPLLMVSLAPLLVSSFAFNFNNFNTIYMLTGGGPKDLTAGVDVGSTDILITFVYKLAFGGMDRQYGFATAVSIIIFVVIATISGLSFRRTRALEDLA